MFCRPLLLLAALPVTWAADIDQPQLFQAARASSGAADGSNADAVRVAGKSAHTVADIRGPGRIVHMWFTVSSLEPDYLSTTRLKIYWDGSKTAAVDVPFGDFHLLGHNRVRQVNSAFVSVEARPELNHNLQNKNVGGFNSYFPMPFSTGARIVIENGSGQLLTLYHQIDYQKLLSARSSLRFHALYRRTAPEKYPGPEAGQRDAKNPDGRDNHLILATEGRGHYVGVSLSVDAAGAGWWEGDEMMWIDGQANVSIQGTGTEDYFGGAWGFRREYSMPYHGVSYLEKVPERKDWQAGQFTVYRFHEKDPVPFTKAFRMSIERGHNNHRRDSGYSSVAFFYLAAP